MANEDLSITYSDVTESLTPGSVIITQPDLTNALVQDRENTLALLSQVSPVAVNDIQIDALGRVIVSNAAFVNALRDKASKEVADINGACGKVNIYKCG